MRKTLKFLIFGSLPFLFILLLIFFFNIIKSDWNYAHKSMYTYQNPFNWFMYKAKVSIAKSFINFRDIIDTGLNEKRIYLEEKKQNQLLIDTPKSTKIWQRGFHFDENKNLSRIQIRLRGDNPRNWLLEKKHWRMKVRKNDIIKQQRYFDYLPFTFDKYFSGKIANRINLLSPNFKLVELYLNDTSKGIYIESENLNESFLRRKKIMPVNMYKTEQILDESIIALDNNIFNSPGVASKNAVFNQLSENDKSDLIFFLDLMNVSYDNKKYFQNLVRSIGVHNWALFTSYQILTQNFHNDNSHNIRFVIDPWTGYLMPIPHDPLIGDINTDNFRLNYSSNDLILLLNKSSEFQHLKLNKLNQILSEKLINRLIDEHKLVEKDLMISEKRDVEALVENFNILNLIKILVNYEYVDNHKNKERLNFLKNYKKYLHNLSLYLKSKPKGNWKKNINGFEISVRKDLPLSNLKIYFNENKPDWIFFDLNENNKIDESEREYQFYSDKDYFLVPYNFYANRLDFRSSTAYLTQIELSTPSTRFKVVTENSSKPYKIEFENPFSKNLYFLYEKDVYSMPTSILNIPVSNKEKIKSVVKLSGVYDINETQIFYDDVIIDAGTKFNLHKNKSIIFKSKVVAKGKKNLPIVFQKAGNENWGTVALQGKNTEGSILNNIIIDGGSGFNKNNIPSKNEKYFSIGNLRYISALSLHKTNNIELKNIVIKNNSTYDDALHIIYCKDISIESLEIKKAFGDAVDIDMSQKIFLKDLKISDSKNDAVDLMESSVFLINSVLTGSDDKAISVGENSYLVIKDSKIKNNNIGIATKDGSFSNIENLSFENNNFHINNYKKNWRYGDGGITVIYESNFNKLNRMSKSFDSNQKPLEIDNFSSLIINNSKIGNEIINQELYSEINKLKHTKKLELLIK